MNDSCRESRVAHEEVYRGTLETGNGKWCIALRCALPPTRVSENLNWDYCRRESRRLSYCGTLALAPRTPFSESTRSSRDDTKCTIDQRPSMNKYCPL